MALAATRHRLWLRLPQVQFSRTEANHGSWLKRSADWLGRFRGLSTTTATEGMEPISAVEAAAANPSLDAMTLKRLKNPFYTQPTKFTTDDGREMLAFHNGPYQRLKPSIVNRRLRDCRTYIGNEKEIRGSPFKLNIICKTIAKLPLLEALTQLKFLNKRKAELVSKVLSRTSNLADIRDGMPKSALEVAECFATRGKHLKRIRYHGKGRYGIMKHRHSHLRVVLREIDFPLRIYQAKAIESKTYWYQLQCRAEDEKAARAAEKEEEARLERENQAKIEASKKV